VNKKGRGPELFEGGAHVVNLKKNWKARGGPMNPLTKQGGGGPPLPPQRYATGCDSRTLIT